MQAAGDAVASTGVRVTQYSILSNMNVVTWNVRGLNKTYKHKELRIAIKENKMGLLTVLEHRIKECKAEKIIKKIVPGWEWVSNYGNNTTGRFWILWNPHVICFTLLEMDPQFIHGQIKVHEANLAFSFIAIYGLHTIQDMRSLWRKLKELEGIQHGPWIAMGDFNAIINEEDRQHGSQVQDIETMDFRDFLTESAMIELQTYGREYTWTNNHTYSRIDRAIVNAAWMNGMPVSQVQIMEPQFSDHSPLKIKFDQYTGGKTKPFRFFNCIAEHQDFLPLIEDCWKLPTPETYMRRVWNKLKSVKQRLKTLNT
ncbi:uncharacterized protein LOC142177361 [Nicotiana tabacum]|uniref:Uncharacterized protein LOC142177361 n=1 Tax=Nicotiana tabacum TaxID=4097 RepID=A0AC58TXJ1_TOBAC